MAAFGRERMLTVLRVLNKTQEYLDVFSRFKQRESIQAVERILSQQTNLAAFEKSQLGTLCCDSAEEAKTLIPSLQNKISDEELQDLLNEVSIGISLGENGLWADVADH